MLDALYNNESKLDQIMTEGFKRIDKAVERVIGKYAPTYDITAVYPSAVMSERHKKAQRDCNRIMSAMVEDAMLNGRAAVKIDINGNIQIVNFKDMMK